MKHPLYIIIGGFLITILLLQGTMQAFAFSTTVTSGQITELTSAQVTDIRNACASLNLGTATFCKSVSQRSISIEDTEEPDVVITAKETKTRKFLTTFAGAVVGSTVESVTFSTLSGNGKFEGAADHYVPKSWGTIYFKNGLKSTSGLMTIQITIIGERPQAPPGSISGLVTDSASNGALEGALIIAKMQGNPSATAQTTTDADGRYNVTGLPAGIYDVEGSSSSYQSRTYTGVAVSSGSNTPLDIGLSLLPCEERPVKDFVGVGFIDKTLGRRESGGDTTSEDYVSESMRYIKANGFTAIRVPYYWESYVFNSDDFLNRIEFIAQTAQENDICVFYVNFHYYTTSYWGLDIEGKPPGRGFPSFVVEDFPPMNNDYVQTAGPFWDAFLSNTILINDKPVWEVQADFLKSIITRVESYDSVAGYEILNEPHFFNTTHYDLAGDYHTYMANEIRTVSDKKIFFDRETTWGFTRSPTLEPNVAPQGVTGIVYAPHLYSTPYPGTQAEDQINNFKAWSLLWGSEVLIGELAPDSQADADQYLSVLKENGFGWTVWSWRPIEGSGLDKSYYESDAVEATEALKILLAAMSKIY